MFQELLIGTSSLLSLLGEEQAPPLRPAHERVLMLCGCRAWIWVSTDLASRPKTGGSRGMRNAQGAGLECADPALCSFGMLTDERGPSLGRVGVGAQQDKNWSGGGPQAKPRCASHVCPEKPYNRERDIGPRIW